MKSLSKGALLLPETWLLSVPFQRDCPMDGSPCLLRDPERVSCCGHMVEGAVVVGGRTGPGTVVWLIGQAWPIQIPHLVQV